MKVKLFNSRIVNQEIKGDCKGEWVTHSKYAFDILPDKSFPGVARFYVAGVLYVDFESCGSAEFHAMLSYRVTEFGDKPDLEVLADTVENQSPLDFEELFIKWDIWAMTSPTDSIWIPEERSKLLDLIRKEIEKHYPN